MPSAITVFVHDLGIAVRREVDDLFQQAVPLGNTVPMDELKDLVPDAELSLPAFNVVTGSYDPRSLKSTLLEFKTMRASSASGSPSPGLMASVLAFPKAQPFAFNIMIATVKTSIADLITQTTIEQKSEIDWKRNGVFVVFGMLYLGGFQYWLQVNMFRKWFPTMDRFANQSFAAKLKDTAGLIDTAKQVLFDVLIHLPFMYFPTFYAVKEFVMGDSWSPVDWVKDGCTKYYNNFRKDFTAMFSLWFPADCVIFAVPIWLRLPVRHVVSLGWTSYLSFLRGGKTAPVPAATAE
eukprot:jgi/Tetstr1/429772/TSEL_019639.t1